MLLVLPSLKHERSFLEAATERCQTDRSNTEEAKNDTHEMFVDYVDRLLQNRVGKRCHLDFVASTE